MDWLTNLIEPLIAALLGGGLVGIFTIPEKKAAAKLDNAERVIAKYEDILKRYEERISELETQVRELEAKNAEKDQRIDDLEHQILEIQAKSITRGANGRFVKKGKKYAAE